MLTPALFASGLIPSNYESLAIAAIALFVVMGCLNTFKWALDIVQFFRRKPPLDEKYATKSELGKMEERINGELTTMEKNQRTDAAEAQKSMKSIERLIADINRSIGRLEGKSES